jgi:chromosomal replication initiator protein
MALASPEAQTQCLEAVQNSLKEQLSLPSYQTWIHPLRLKALDEATGEVTLLAPSAFSQSYVLAHYRGLLEGAWEAALGQEVTLLWEVQTEASELSPQQAAEIAANTYVQASQMPAQRSWTPRAQQSHLNARYTFEQLVVGQHNRFPHAAAMAIAEHPATAYNPFFVYGPVGLGKTHLVQAIGHHILQHPPQQASHGQQQHNKVLYVTAEQFTNEMIQAISKKGTSAFRERYRSQADVLIIDDVQFLEGKERTQEELFHTFNSLYEAGKQLILTSDRHPKLLTSLEDRLRSRFECGLMADIQPPDLETRVAILQLKAERENLHQRLKLDLSLLELIAERYPTNIRELEGALNKVAAYAMLTNSTLSPALLENVLGVVLDQRRMSMDSVVAQVARYYHLNARDLKGPNRSKEVSLARQICITVLRDLFSLSYPKIGELLGGRKHATIVYAYERMKGWREKTPLVAQQLDELMQGLKSGRGLALPVLEED